MHARKLPNVDAAEFFDQEQHTNQDVTDNSLCHKRRFHHGPKDFQLSSSSSHPTSLMNHVNDDPSMFNGSVGSVRQRPLNGSTVNCGDDLPSSNFPRSLIRTSSFKTTKKRRSSSTSGSDGHTESIFIAPLNTSSSNDTDITSSCCDMKEIPSRLPNSSPVLWSEYARDELHDADEINEQRQLLSCSSEDSTDHYITDDEDETKDSTSSSLEVTKGEVNTVVEKCVLLTPLNGNPTLSPVSCQPSPPETHLENLSLDQAEPQYLDKHSMTASEVPISKKLKTTEESNSESDNNSNTSHSLSWNSLFQTSKNLCSDVEKIANSRPCMPLLASNQNNNKTILKSNSDSNSLLYGCRCVDVYKKLNKISEGTYGSVYRGQDRTTGDIVALKHIKYHEKIWEEGFPLTSLREIAILMELKHQNIVNVREVVVGANPNQVYMVMEYIEHELKTLLEQDRPPFSLAERKALMYQLLEAVDFMHSHWVVHRDLKTSNLLYSNKGTLKVCDFGMARKFGDPIRPYTHNVVTLWYRAPELLLGATEYTQAVDIWSTGCIIAEILLKRPLFDSKNEVEALDKIFKLCGTPTERSWPGLQRLPFVAQHKMEFSRHSPSWRSVFPVYRTHLTETAALSDVGLHFLRCLLAVNPFKRISAKEALEHPFFSEKPLPQRPHLMPSAPETNTKVRDVRPSEINENDSKNRSLFHDLNSRFGARIDAQRYLNELETVAKSLSSRKAA